MLKFCNGDPSKLYYTQFSLTLVFNKTTTSKQLVTYFSLKIDCFGTEYFYESDQNSDIQTVHNHHIFDTKKHYKTIITDSAQRKESSRSVKIKEYVAFGYFFRVEFVPVRLLVFAEK